jgi:Polyketide cyclase / dehydrase and lipid transport
MTRSQHAVTIDRPADEIFEFLADGSDNHQWQPPVVNTTQTDSPLGVGHQTVRHPFGFRVSADYRVVAYEPPESSRFRPAPAVRSAPRNATSSPPIPPVARRCAASSSISPTDSRNRSDQRAIIQLAPADPGRGHPAQTITVASTSTRRRSSLAVSAGSGRVGGRRRGRSAPDGESGRSRCPYCPGECANLANTSKCDDGEPRIDNRTSAPAERRAL